MLLAVLPYLAAAALYLFNTRDLFLSEKPPPHWYWRLVAPVMVAGLTPMALASKAEGLAASDRGLLISAPLVGVVFMIFAFGRLGAGDFYALRLPVGLGDWRLDWLPRSRLWMWIGVAIIVYACATNIYVSWMSEPSF